MAGQTDRPTKPITSSDTINVIINTVMPAIEEIKGNVKVIDEKVRNIEGDVKDVNDVIKQFRTTLYGNGNVEDVGIVGKLSQVEKFIKSRTFYEKLVAGILVSETIGFFFVVIKYFLIK